LTFVSFSSGRTSITHRKRVCRGISTNKPIE